MPSTKHPRPGCTLKVPWSETIATTAKRQIYFNWRYNQRVGPPNDNDMNVILAKMGVNWIESRLEAFLVKRYPPRHPKTQHRLLVIQQGYDAEKIVVTVGMVGMQWFQPPKFYLEGAGSESELWSPLLLGLAPVVAEAPSARWEERAANIDSPEFMKYLDRYGLDV